MEYTEQQINDCMTELESTTCRMAELKIPPTLYVSCLTKLLILSLLTLVNEDKEKAIDFFKNVINSQSKKTNH